MNTIELFGISLIHLEIVLPFGLVYFKKKSIKNIIWFLMFLVFFLHMTVTFDWFGIYTKFNEWGWLKENGLLNNDVIKIK